MYFGLTSISRYGILVLKVARTCLGDHIGHNFPARKRAGDYDI